MVPGIAAGAALVLMAAACGAGASARSTAPLASALSATTTTTVTTVTTATTVPPATSAPPSTATSVLPSTTAPSRPPAPPLAAPFTASVSTVIAADLPHTWHPGCPVAPSQLRMLRLTYRGFDQRAHSGEIVVNAGVVAQVIAVFRTLFDERFPIAKMVPQDAYGGNDNAAAAADDTSGFNCRPAVAPGPPQWSVHAYGEAIDVNDVENPYSEGGRIIPPAGAAYLDRADVRPGMAVPGGSLVDAFASVGWYWGGRWTASPDYQHFSSTGG